jgi:predicted transcriptional regulator
MTKPTSKQLAALGAAFEAFARRYKLAEALSSEKPLNELDKQALFYVADHPGCGPSDIARFLTVPNTTISSATDRLVARGLLKRKRPPDDRRAVALHLRRPAPRRRLRRGASRAVSPHAGTAVGRRARQPHRHDHENSISRRLNNTNFVISSG